jgi:quinohemoprotein ethanol dehydrogenase
MRMHIVRNIRRILSPASGAVALALLAGCSGIAPKGGAAAQGGEPDAPTIKMLSDTADGANWAGYGRTFDETHYSPLDQINDGNVKDLSLKWSIDLPPMPSVVGAPLAVDGILYFGIGYSIVYAVDAESGKTLWTFDPKVTEVAGDKLQSAWGIRGIAYWGGKIYTGTQDGRLIAIDGKTGKQIWSVQTTEGAEDGRYITGAPRVFKDMVIIGHGGADFANVRGYVTAYDARTGAQRWRFYTVPGDPKKGPDGAASDEALAKVTNTWTGEWWKYGAGGTAWNAMTYDPELDRIYIGTGNGAPWNRNVRSPGGGDNLFLCSIIALDAKTGKYVWHYQTTPGESWDYNSAQDMSLATLKIDGKDRRVILHAPKNGFFYVIDRDTGKLISAKPFVKVTWASGVDLKTGRPIENPEARSKDKPIMVFPSPAGGHNWHAQSFSPKTGLVYLPVQDMPGLHDPRGIDAKTWHRNGFGLDAAYRPIVTKGVLPGAGGAKIAALIAWDPVAQKKVWSVPLPGALNGGVASTGGNLVFEGNLGGKFVAYDAKSGKLLWSFDAQNGIAGQPITYSVKGVQYVTVIAGVGGTSGVMGALLGEDKIFGYREQKRRVLTFALGGKATLPAVSKPAVTPIADDPSFVIDPKLVDRGAEQWTMHCQTCHGAGVVAGGAAPDLRRSGVPLDEGAFRQVVLDGMLLQNGMPKFRTLSPNDIAALRTYIRYQARAAKAAGDR